MYILSRNEKRKKKLGNQQEILIFFSLIHPPTSVDYIVQGVRLCCSALDARAILYRHILFGWADEMDTLRQSLLGALGAGRESDRALFLLFLFCFVFFPFCPSRCDGNVKSTRRNPQFKVKSTAAAAAGQETFLCVRPAVDGVTQ